MNETFLLVQLSDPHIGGTWAPHDPIAGWQAAVEAVRRLPDPPDAVLVSGDLADGAADAEYAVVKSALATLAAPAYVLPGNHDDRQRLRQHFQLPGQSDAPVHYAVDLGPLRLIVLDTIRPGRDSGQLDTAQLAWLDQELATAPHETVLLAMHHPPFVTGVPAWDAIGLNESDRSALRDIIQRHPHVRRILAGHVHRAMLGELAGRIAFCAPSTYVQGRPSVDGADIDLTDEPAAFAVHAVRRGEVVSSIHAVVPEPASSEESSSRSPAERTRPSGTEERP